MDVENFKHPGPQKLIDENVGKDITELFDDIGHSASAVKMMEDLHVGYVKRDESKKREGALMSNAYDSVSAEEKAMHDRLDSLIDIKKPLIPQIRKLTNEEFMAFVRRPRFINDEDGIQLFEDKEFDTARKRPFEKNVVVIGTVIALCLCISFMNSTTNEFAFNVALYFIVGSVIAWTFIEYFFHRFMLHTEINLDKNEKADPDVLEKIFSQHVHHHVFMN